jgi:hypothetical protein
VSGLTMTAAFSSDGCAYQKADFLVVPTINFRLLSVLVILRHERRRLPASVTACPARALEGRLLTPDEWCPRCIWEINQVQLDKPPWSGSSQRYRCLAAVAASSGTYMGQLGGRPVALLPHLQRSTTAPARTRSWARL